MVHTYRYIFLLAISFILTSFKKKAYFSIRALECGQGEPRKRKVLQMKAMREAATGHQRVVWVVGGTELFPQVHKEYCYFVIWKLT